MKRPTPWCLAVAVFLAASSRIAAAGGNPNDWPMYGHDLHRTAFNGNETKIDRSSVGLLAPKWVFHAVGPVYRGREKDVEQLASCHLKCLDLAVEKGCCSIAFPAISTGSYGYPVAEASVIAVGAVHGWLLNHPDWIERIVFVLFDADTLKAYQSAHQR